MSNKALSGNTERTILVSVTKWYVSPSGESDGKKG